MRAFRRHLLVAFALATPALAPAQQREPATRLGFSPSRLARIDGFLQQARWTASRDRRRRGARAARRPGRLRARRRLGRPEAGRRMTHRRRCSASRRRRKALTSVAILTLVEEGKLGLDDPVSRFIPALRADHRGVAEPTRARAIGAGAPRASPSATSSPTPPASPTAPTSLVAPLYSAKGLGPAAGFGWYTADKDEPVCTTIERLAHAALRRAARRARGCTATTPTSSAASSSGRPAWPLDAFIRSAHHRRRSACATRHFFLPPEKRGRLAAVYASDGRHADRARAPDGAARPGPLRRRPAPQLLRRRGPAVHGARLRAASCRCCSSGGDARRRAHPRPEDGGADDERSGGHAVLPERRRVRARLQHRRPAAARTAASSRWGRSDGAARTAAPTRSIPRSGSCWCS